MVQVFPKSVHQLNKMALTILIWFPVIVLGQVDERLENLANGKEISTVLFQTEAENYLLAGS